MSNSRAGAVVVRVVSGQKSYLLVGPKSGDAEWLLPKGHIEAGESAAMAALREVREEAGVRSALMASLGTTPLALPGGAATVEWFLALYVGEVSPAEKRALCWLPYQQAHDALSFPELRATLARAEDEASRIWPSEQGPGPLYATTLQSQLTFLNERMKETSNTANSFLTRFVFGGMVAVVALLNVDLVLLKEPVSLDTPGRTLLYAFAALLVLALSLLYFRTVQAHYDAHRKSHRKLKYKYELTMAALLTPSTPERYSEMMERSVSDGKLPAGYPSSFGFSTLGSYLLGHHGERLRETAKRDGVTGKGESYVPIAMLLVLITFVIRIAGVALTPPREAQKPTQLDVQLRQASAVVPSTSSGPITLPANAVAPQPPSARSTSTPSPAPRPKPTPTRLDADGNELP